MVPPNSLERVRFGLFRVVSVSSFLSFAGGSCGAWGREGLVEFFVIEMV